MRCPKSVGQARRGVGEVASDLRHQALSAVQAVTPAT